MDAQTIILLTFFLFVALPVTVYLVVKLGVTAFYRAKERFAKPPRPTRRED